MITTVRTLECEYCPRTKRGRRGQGAQSLREQAERAGWRSSPNPLGDGYEPYDSCPACVKKYAAGGAA